MPVLTLILPIIHYSVCSISLIFGSLLLFLLIFHTPNRLKVFAVLLRTLTIVELTTSLAAIFVFPRLIPLGFDAAVVVINGPIKWMTDNLTISWIAYTCELHGTQQYNAFMSICYCYRYYVLRRKRSSTIFEIRIFTLIVFFTSFALYVLFAYCRASPEELIVYINRHVIQYNIDLKETIGVVNVLNSLATPAIVWTVLTACVLSIVNVIVGTACYRYLKYHSENISEKNRAYHSQLFMALTVQALFGQLLLFYAGGYALGQLNLIRSPFLEHSAHTMTEIAIAASPVITLIFVKPYQRSLKSLFQKHKVGVKTTTTRSSSN